MSEAVELMGGAKTPIEEHWGTTGTFPTTSQLNSAGVRLAGKYTSSITSAPATATLTATMRQAGTVNGNIAAKTVTLSMATATGIWTCAAGSVDPKYLPASCR
jgi:type IV pilus assembly protein PilA